MRPAASVYQWKHFIGGHMGRLGTRADMVLYQQYVNDIIDGVKKALATVDPTPYFALTRPNPRAAGPGRGCVVSLMTPLHLPCPTHARQRPLPQPSRRAERTRPTVVAVRVSGRDMILVIRGPG